MSPDQCCGTMPQAQPAWAARISRLTGVDGQAGLTPTGLLLVGSERAPLGSPLPLAAASLEALLQAEALWAGSRPGPPSRTSPPFWRSLRGQLPGRREAGLYRPQERWSP